MKCFSFILLTVFFFNFLCFSGTDEALQTFTAFVCFCVAFFGFIYVDCEVSLLLLAGSERRRRRCAPQLARVARASNRQGAKFGHTENAAKFLYANNGRRRR